MALGDLTGLGTEEYIPPEVWQGGPETERPRDWWTFGMLLHEMMCGTVPFFHENPYKLGRLIVAAAVPYPDHMSQISRDLVSQLLEKDPAKRLGAGDRDYLEIKEHGFFAGIDWNALYRKEIEPEWRPPLPDGLL
jgi:serine/threonine protein kinase